MAKIPDASGYTSPPRRPSAPASRPASVPQTPPQPVRHVATYAQRTGDGGGPLLFVLAFVVVLLLSAIVLTKCVGAAREWTVTPGEGASYVNLRQDPSTMWAPLRQLQPGDRVNIKQVVVAGDGSEWALVVLSDGSEGYIKRRLLRP